MPFSRPTYTTKCDFETPYTKNDPLYNTVPFSRPLMKSAFSIPPIQQNAIIKPPIQKCHFQDPPIQENMAFLRHSLQNMAFSSPPYTTQPR